MVREGGGSDDLTLQLQAARAMTPGLEVQQLKASVRAQLFGVVEAPPRLGDYTIVRLIGRGGMGAVYEARDGRGEVVALKMLRGCEPAALVRFKQGFRALSDVVHPNLALLYSLQVTDEQAFLTMERVEGVDFLSYCALAEAPEVDPTRRLRGALAQLVAGLGALHAAGKLHRDVKPSNVLVTQEGRVVVLDFGLVQELAGPGPPGGEALAGTPAYMAPELVRGGSATTASDWYSVGVMLYEALTGGLPFVGSGLAVLREKCERDPVRPDRGAEPGLVELCMALLARDPAARPDRRAIAARLAGLVDDDVAVGTGGSRLSLGTDDKGIERAGRGPGEAPLIGRAGELAALRQALADVRAGRPGVALVRGRSGLGKTALVDAFLAGLEGEAAVLRGRCYEREQVPHNAFDGLVEAIVDHLMGLPAAAQRAALGDDVAALVRLFPGLKRVGVGPAGEARDEASAPESRWRERAYAAFKGLLGSIAGRTAVVLYIDDLHWADADSATLLATLVSHPAPRCLLVASYQASASGPAPVVQGLVQQLRGGGARMWELTLEPLRLGEAELLARALLGPGPASESAGVVARESAGSPLFIHALVHDVLGCISAGAGAWPARLEELLAARVAQLPRAARELLEVLAVAARPLPRALVMALAGPSAAGRAALRTLGSAGMVRAGRSERGELIEVYHDRIGETVRAGLDDERGRACHRRLAAALASCEGEVVEPEILAHHLHAAGEPEDARQHMITAAGRATQALAFARAAELSLAAIRLCAPEDREGRQALRVAGAQAWMHAGQAAAAAQCFLAAASEAPPVQALHLRRRAAEVLLNCGAPHRGLTLLQEVLAALGRPAPRTRLARALRAASHERWLARNALRFTPRTEAGIAEPVLLRLDTLRAARLAVLNVDPVTARMYQLEHLRECLEVGEPRRIVHAIAGHACYVSHAGERGAAEVGRLLAQAQALAACHGLAEDSYLPACAGLVAFNLGRWGAAREHLASALTKPRGGPPSPGEGVIHSMCGQWSMDCSFFLGDLRGMSQQREAYLAVLRAVGDKANDGRLDVSMHVFTALAADDPSGAARGLTAILGRWPDGGFARDRATAFRAERAIDVYSGDGPRAWARCAERWPAYVASYMYQGQHGRVLGEFWRAATALQAALVASEREAGRLRGVAEQAARTIARQGARWAEPLGLLLRAAAQAQRGRRREAAQMLARAIAGLEGAGMLLWTEAARWQASRLAGEAESCEAQAQRMRARGVLAPARMAATLAPGFPD